MSTRTARAGIAAVVAAVALTGAACGGSDDAASTSTSTTAAESTTTTAAAKEGTLTVSSASYDKTFPVTSCVVGNETELALTAAEGGFTATVTAWGGSGALKVEGGDESDGVSLEGVIDTLEVGDAGDLSGEGTYTGSNYEGEPFTLTGSCAGAEPATTTTAPGSKAVADASKAELEVWQKDLNIVACYVGAVDGTLGPKTRSAVKAFQAASGLSPDGVLGPQTEAALKEAAAAKRVVCTATSTDGSTSTKPVLKISSPGYDKSFVIGSCTSGGESSVDLEAQADGLTATLDATDGSGTLSVSGATESDGISLSGNVTSVTVGDTGDLEATGTFSGSNLSGENFTITGSCA